MTSKEYIKNLPFYKRLKNLLIIHEGYEYHAYKCTAGYHTIGIGYNIDAHMPEFAGKRLSLDDHEINMLFIESLSYAIDDCFNVFKKFDEIIENNHARACALIDMAFNLGRTRLKKFKRMVKAVNKREWQQAAIEAQESLWFEQVGSRGVRIVEMLRTGDFCDVVK